MAIIWTVYSGSLGGPSARDTEDPIEALGLARDAGPSAFVTSNRGGERRYVWTPESDRRCAGELHRAVIDRALTAAAAG